MESILSRARQIIEPQRKVEWYEELESEVCGICPSLSWQQRIGGCLICIFIGLCLSLGSLFRIIELLKGNPMPFAIMYSLGNIIAISATCFLYGPYAQLKKMFEFTRIVATSVFLLMITITLFLAFYDGHIPLRVLWIVLAIIIQFFALVWYSLSFIPFARDIVQKFVVSMCCCDCRSQSSNGWESWHG